MGRGYGAMVVQRSRPVIPPLGEARSNHEVFGETSEKPCQPFTSIGPCPPRSGCI